VVFVLATGGILFWQMQPAAAIGSLQVFNGSAQIVRTGQPEGGNTGSPIRLKDHIKAADGSKVAIVLKDNTIIRIEGGSEVEVANLTYENGKLKDADIKLISGRMWSRVKPLQQGSNFEVETPTVTAAVRGTSFNTTFKDQISGIYVYQSEVEVALNQNGDKQNVEQTQLLQMHQSTLGNDFNKGTQTPPEEFFDEWILFNQAEDDKLCKQWRDIPGCDTAKRVVQGATTTTPEPAPAPTPPPPTTRSRGTTPTSPPIASPATLQSINVSCTFIPPTVFTFVPPPQYQCNSNATYSNGQVTNVTNNTSWSLLNPDPKYGSITQSGVYTRLNTCIANSVKASYNDKQNSFDFPIAPSCSL
jgi:hypothetical protein